MKYLLVYLSRIMKIKIFIIYCLLCYISVSHAENCEGIVGADNVPVVNEVDVNKISSTNTASQNRNFLNHSQKNKKHPLEQQLTQQGYRKVFTKGVDEAWHLIELAKTLRDKKIDPKTTHIPEFADMVMKHIDFIKREYKKFSIVTNNNENKKMLALSKIKEQAKEKINNKEVTYQWWLSLNLVLTAMTPEDIVVRDGITVDNTVIEQLLNNHSITNITRRWISNYNFPDRVPFSEKITTSFPDIIYMPTITPVGVIAINSALANRVTFLEVNIKPFDDSFNPRTTFEKGIYAHNIENTNHYKMLLNMYNRFTQARNTLSNTELEMVEMIFFYMLYYNKHHQKFFFSIKNRVKQAIKQLIKIKSDYSIGGEVDTLLPEHIKTNPDKINDYLNQSLNMFLHATGLLGYRTQL